MPNDWHVCDSHTGRPTSFGPQARMLDNHNCGNILTAAGCTYTLLYQTATSLHKLHGRRP